MKSYHYTHFRNKDGRSELMLRDMYENKAAKSLTDFKNKDGRSELMFRYIYENESSKVINLNSFGCGLNTQKNALSKAKSKEQPS